MLAGAAWRCGARPASQRCTGAHMHVSAAPCRPHAARGATPGRWPALRVAAALDLAKLSDKAYLDKAARRFQMGVEQGLEPGFLIAVELGASSEEGLSDAQRQYAGAVRAKLEQRAAELAAEDLERRQREAAYLEAGKKAYERGQYSDSVSFLEQAVDKAGRNSVTGGEALMWLALAYQAVGREQDCIDTYKWLEDNHPAPKVRKQAADLRYIMEAPKLELSPDERVTIPLISSDDAWARRGRRSAPPKAAPGSGPKAGGGSYWDRVDWDAPQSPLPLPDKWYVRVAWAVLLVGVTLYANTHLPLSGGH